MILKTIEIYTIDELTKDSQKYAYEKWLTNCEYLRSDDNKLTLQKFCEIFPIKNLEWEYGDGYNYINFKFEYFDYDEEITDLKGIRLLKYIINNYYNDIFKPKTYFSKGYKKSRKSKITLNNDCVLTGLYLDLSILDPIYNFIKNPCKHTTFNMLMKECLNSWLKDCQSDFEYCISFEYFIEEAQGNNYEYLSNGAMA